MVTLFDLHLQNHTPYYSMLAYHNWGDGFLNAEDLEKYGISREKFSQLLQKEVY